MAVCDSWRGAILEICQQAWHIEYMRKEEPKQKVITTEDLALQELERRTHLRLQGLPATEIYRLLEEWEKTHKVSKK